MSSTSVNLTKGYPCKKVIGLNVIGEKLFILGFTCMRAFSEVGFRILEKSRVGFMVGLLFIGW